MIRSIIAVVEIVLFFIISLPVLLVEWLIGLKFPKARDISSLRFVQGFIRFLLWSCGVKVDVVGKENLPTDKPVLYIMNHRSLFDILVTLVNMPAPTGYIGKKEIMKVPVLNIWMIFLRGFALDRTNIKEGLKTILAAIDQVKNGTSVAIFPEGTRGRDADQSELLPFHEGSFKVATKSGCPIVPVAISGTSAILEDHFPRIKGQRVTVQYLEPINVAELSKEDKKFVGKYTQDKIHSALTALK